MKAFAAFLVALAGIGMLWVLIASVLLLNPLLLKSKGEVAEGKVVDYVQKGKGQLARVVKFTTARGQVVTFTSKTSSNFSSDQIGDPVRILYLPATPREAEIDDFQSLWLPGGIFGGLGLLAAYVGFIGLYQLRGQKDDPAVSSSPKKSKWEE
jgi:hypothetical protein